MFLNTRSETLETFSDDLKKLFVIFVDYTVVFILFREIALLLYFKWTICEFSLASAATRGVVHSLCYENLFSFNSKIKLTRKIMNSVSLSNGHPRHFEDRL